MSSPAQKAWSSFRNNLPAMIGLGYLILCILVAIFANLLTPDPTRHANRQQLTLAKRPPGTQATVLLVPLESASLATLGQRSFLGGADPTHRPVALAEGKTLSVTETHLRYTEITGRKDSLSLARFGYDAIAEAAPFDWQPYVQTQTFHLGTDTYGRDVLSRLLLGARVSLAIGLLAVGVSLIFGIVLGVLAGYWGGWIDRLVMWFTSVVWSVPALLLALALSFVMAKGFTQLFLAIGLAMWVEVARVVRGQIISLREQPYTEAAKVLGMTDVRVMFRHILPNVLSPLIVIAVANFGAAVLIESGLSFLGMGIGPPVPTWGQMINEGYTYIVFSHGRWLALYPGLALIGLIVSINLMGIGLRDALDVRQ